MPVVAGMMAKLRMTFSIDFRGQGKRFKQANQRLAYRNKINEKIWVTDPQYGLLKGRAADVLYSRGTSDRR
jgi:hypothetical protein